MKKTLLVSLAIFSISVCAGVAFAEQLPDYSSNEITLPSEFIPDETTTNSASETLEPMLAGQSITVRNHSNRRACIAIIDASPEQARGWFVIENGVSKSFSNVSYIHAEECGNSVSWNPGWDLRYFCVKRVNGGAPFSIYTPSNSSMCTSLGGVMDKYYRISGGTWTLNW